MQKVALALAMVVGLCICIGCEGVDIKYQDASSEMPPGPLQMAKDGGIEGGDIVMADASVLGAEGFCDCDHRSGYGCCLLPNTDPFCAENASMNGCAAKGGMFIGCEKYNSVDDSACCWNYGTGAGSLTAYAGLCGQRPTACMTNDDCLPNVACKITTCKGLKVGACGVMPTCP